jgi:hypothetical protein
MEKRGALSSMLSITQNLGVKIHAMLTLNTMAGGGSNLGWNLLNLWCVKSVVVHRPITQSTGLELTVIMSLVTYGGLRTRSNATIAGAIIL